MIGCLGCLTILAIAAISYGVCYFLTWLICLCFGLAFTWKIAMGVWLILILFKGSITIKNN